MAEALCYNRRADKVRAHLEIISKICKTAEVSKSSRSKISVEIVEIVMHHLIKDHIGVRMS